MKVDSARKSGTRRGKSTDTDKKVLEIIWENSPAVLSLNDTVTFEFLCKHSLQTTVLEYRIQ